MAAVHAIARRSLMNAAANGDQCRIWQCGPDQLLAMADGLGHGPEAEIAALAALDFVESHLEQPLSSLFEGCDRALRGTRGTALELLRISPGGAEYAGIGNTGARIWQAAHQRSLRLSGDYGIVGAGFRRLNPRPLSLAAGDLVVLHTDGISEKFDLKAYPALTSIALPTLAQQLLQDWGKSHDDAAVLIYRHGLP